MQQIMAGLPAGRSLIYHSFGVTYQEKKLVDWIDELNEVLVENPVTVGRLSDCLFLLPPSDLLLCI